MARGLLSILSTLLVVLLIGCGGEGTSETATVDLLAKAPETGKEGEIRTYLRRHYGDEAWYPNVEEINVEAGAAFISTFLKYDPPENHRHATEVCTATLESKVVPRVVVLWGESETDYCEKGKKLSVTWPTRKH
jgi:hypothetical protein